MVDHRSRPDTDEFPAVAEPVIPGGIGKQPAVSTGPARNPKRATGFTLGALAVLLLIVVGAIAFMVAGTGSDASSDEAAPAPTSTQAPSPNPDTSPAETEVPEATPVVAPEEASGTVTVTETPDQAGRPTNPPLPGGHSPVNDAARSNTPAGDLNNVYTGTQTTSPDFALNVRDAFVRYYLDTGELNGQISAVSPITGLTYDLTCQDNGGFVTCTGGDNAVIYIS